MALGLAAALPSLADDVVAYATGGWFAVDSREVKDATERVPPVGVRGFGITSKVKLHSQGQIQEKQI